MEGIDLEDHISVIIRRSHWRRTCLGWTNTGEKFHTDVQRRIKIGKGNHSHHTHDQVKEVALEGKVRGRASWILNCFSAFQLGVV
jgi:hypothetical protein